MIQITETMNKYYRVYMNDTTVTEVSSNDFNRLNIKGFSVDVQYSIPPGRMFYGYTTRAHAMEMAKAGALKYIESMIRQVKSGIDKLVQYRNDHYQDLNVNLLDSSIRKLEREMYFK